MSAEGPPSGVVTFLFPDVEGSTRRWEADADGMRVALAAHDEVLRAAIEGHGGWLFKHTGDGVCLLWLPSPRVWIGWGGMSRRPPSPASGSTRPTSRSPARGRP